MLIFKCEHCNLEKEYNRSSLGRINTDTVDIKGHVVCKECGDKYKDINKQVQEFADMKREELEAEFFNKTEEKPKKKDLDLDE